MIKFAPFLISLIAGLSTMIGCLFIYLKPKKVGAFIGAALAFSATVMLLISVFELIPEGFIYLEYKYNLIIAILSLILMLFIGNLISSKINKEIAKHKAINSNLYRVGILSMIALMIHNIPEGILTYLSGVVNIELGLKFGFAIMMHNIPEGIAIAVPIYYSTKSKKKALKSTLVSGLSEPIGAIIAWIFLSRFISEAFISIILLFVAGLMISIAINDIFGEANKYSRKYILLGVGLAIIMFIANIIVFH